MHLHTELSNGVTNIDSITKIDQYIEKAKKLGMKAMCFTEHGSVFRWVYKKQHLESAGIKYIHGSEFYVTETLFEKTRDNYHCILIAKNYDGVLEINKLLSNAFNRKDGHFYYAPRITFDELINTSDNVIVTTACLGGILNNGNEELKDRFIRFLSDNKHRCYLEIQHHNVEDQIKYNQYLYNLSVKYNIPLIAGTDTHALDNIHMDGRKILQIAKNVRFANEDSWDLTFKSYDELVAAFKKQNSLPIDIVLDAIESTNRLSDSVEEFKLDYSYKYPHLWEKSEETFLQKIEDGIRQRGVDRYPNYQEYRDRIEYELAAYKHNGAIDFMLLMEDIISWCVENDILVGYGRGSCNGSVIAWLLGITEMDSIKHGLNFDRFMNVERVSLSDIDTDFPPSRIDDVKDYIFSKTGLYCCDIVTFNTIAMKGAIRDVGRALEIPLDEVGAICDLVESNESDLRKKYPELFKYVDLVNGTVVSVGSHPCGCICSPHEIDDRLGTFSTSTSNYRISQVNMKEVDGLNYVKLDLLRLDTIELINETCKLAGIDRLTPDNVDTSDIKVWNAMRDDTTQIFQWEGKTGNDYIKKLMSDENIKKFQEVNEDLDRMMLLTIGNSAIRPAGESYREDLASGVVRSSGSKAIDEFLRSTFGYLVFQCQIIEFLHSYCGFTMGEADIVRRHFSKKTGTEDDIPVIKDGGYMKDSNGKEKTDHYIDGFIVTMEKKYGMKKEDSENAITAFLKVIIDASEYLFSINHSAPYSYEGYVSGWLRYYYPLEFLTTALNINRDKEEKTQALTNYAKKISIEIRPPKFRYSKSKYFCDKESKCIYKGIGSIKYLNSVVADELFNLRKKTYDSFIDLLIDIQSIGINSRQLDILIKLDYFSEFGGINYLLKCVELFSIFYNRNSIKKDKLLEYGISETDIRPFSQKETNTRVDEIDCVKYIMSIGKNELDLSDCIKYKRVGTEKVKNGYSTKLTIKKYDISEEKQIEFATKIVVGQFSGLSCVEILKNLANKAENNPTSIRDKIGYELEYLGYIDVIDKKYKGFCVVIDLNVDYSPRVSLYALANGNIIPVKIDKKLFKITPLKRGDIIKVKNQCRLKKKRAAGKDEKGKTIFIDSDEEEWWITDYKIV